MTQPIIDGDTASAADTRTVQADLATSLFGTVKAIAAQPPVPERVADKTYAGRTFRTHEREARLALRRLVVLLCPRCSDASPDRMATRRHMRLIQHELNRCAEVLLVPHPRLGVLIRHTAEDLRALIDDLDRRSSTST